MTTNQFQLIVARDRHKLQSRLVLTMNARAKQKFVRVILILAVLAMSGCGFHLASNDITPIEIARYLDEKSSVASVVCGIETIDVSDQERLKQKLRATLYTAKARDDSERLQFDKCQFVIHHAKEPRVISYSLAESSIAVNKDVYQVDAKSLEDLVSEIR